MQHEHTSQRFYHNPKILIPILVAAILLTATVGTMAWLRYDRSLQTVTLIHVSDLYLEGPNGVDSTAINLGSIGPGSNYYAFGVKSNVARYKLQLAYTTNLPLRYSIHPASKEPTESLTTPVTIDGITFYYNQNQTVAGEYLNSANGQVADSSRHDITYAKSDGSSGAHAFVQKNAEPVYWQTPEFIDATVGFVDYYLLEVSWIGEMQSNKETDMIYLTAGSGSTGGSQ